MRLVLQRPLSRIDLFRDLLGDPRRNILVSNPVGAMFLDSDFYTNSNCTRLMA